MDEFDLTTKEDKEKIQEQINSFKEMSAPDLVSKFLSKIKKQLKEVNQPQIEQEYADIISDLEWLSIQLRSQVDLKRMLAKDLMKVLTWEDFNLIDKFDDYLIIKVPLLLRDEFKKEIMGVLRENEERLTEQDLKDANDLVIPSTISNWLREYDLFVGTGLVDKLKKTEFIYQSKNTSKLDKSERDILIKLIDFYEHLKVTSEHPTGLEGAVVFKDERRILEVDHGKVTELAVLPEVEKKEDEFFSPPKAQYFLEEEEKKSHLDDSATQASQESKKEEKFVKPVDDFIAPTLKEAQDKMVKKEEIKKSKLQPKVEIPAPIDLPKPPVLKPKIIPKPMPQPIPTPQRDIPKPIMADVKAPQRVLSLTDELRFMTVDEFRKLGAEKIREKMALLENKSMEKRAEGIESWKKSPVNLLYLEIGQESVIQGRGVREVIQQRETSGQPVLTYAEFEDLADLNKSLRF